MAHRDPRQIHTGGEVHDDTSTRADLAVESHTRVSRAGEAPPRSQLPEPTSLPLRMEELVASKQLVQTERVLIRTKLVTETKMIEVAVTREELIVEHLPPEQWSAETDAVQATHDGPENELINRLRALQPGETVRLPLLEEEVVIELQPVVVEEVSIGRRLVRGTQQVSGTIRREEVRVEQVEGA